MTTFQVGDIVQRTRDCWSGINTGDTATVIEILPNSSYMRLQGEHPNDRLAWHQTIDFVLLSRGPIEPGRSAAVAQPDDIPFTTNPWGTILPLPLGSSPAYPTAPASGAAAPRPGYQSSNSLLHSSLGPVDDAHLAPKPQAMPFRTGCECGAHSVGVDHHSTWCKLWSKT